MEQAPAPRGSPHDPQAAGAASEKDEADEAAPPLADTAKTDSCGSSFLLWHFGHSAFCWPKTIASNSCWHCLQMYSKMGMKKTPRRNQLLFKIKAWPIRKYRK